MPATTAEMALAQMRLASGTVVDNRALTMFLYFLAAEEVPLGKIETLVMKIMAQESYWATYGNGWLAEWAKFTADRLSVMSPRLDVAPPPDPGTIPAGDPEPPTVPAKPARRPRASRKEG